MSVAEIKVRIVKIMCHKQTVGYFDASQAATKCWICCENDLAALDAPYEAYPRKEILL